MKCWLNITYKQQSFKFICHLRKAPFLWHKCRDLASLPLLHGGWNHWHYHRFMTIFIAPAATYATCRPCFRSRICYWAHFKQLLSLSWATGGWCMSWDVSKHCSEIWNFISVICGIAHGKWLLGCVIGLVLDLWTDWAHKVSVAHRKLECQSVNMCVYKVRHCWNLK